MTPRGPGAAPYQVEYLSGRDLSDTAEEAIAVGLTAALPELRMTAYFQARRRELRTYDHVVLARSTSADQVVGALASAWRTTAAGQPFLHVPLHMIARDLRGARLFLAMWAEHWRHVAPTANAFPFVVAIRTYNPGVYAFVQSFEVIEGVSVYPRIDRAAQDPNMARLASGIAHAVSPGCSFDPETGVVRGCGVPPDLYRALPLTARRPVQGYFASHLAPADRLLTVTQIAGPEAQGAIVHRFDRTLRYDRADVQPTAPAKAR